MIRRRGAGRHARRPGTGRPAPPAWPAAPPWPAAPAGPTAFAASAAPTAPAVASPAAVPAQAAPPLPAPLAPRSAVRLWFRDGSVLALRPDDPLAVALRAAADALLAP